jgi:hypothetical protein
MRVEVGLGSPARSASSPIPSAVYVAPAPNFPAFGSRPTTDPVTQQHWVDGCRGTLVHLPVGPPPGWPLRALSADPLVRRPQRRAFVVGSVRSQGAPAHALRPVHLSRPPNTRQPGLIPMPLSGRPRSSVIGSGSHAIATRSRAARSSPGRSALVRSAATKRAGRHRRPLLGEQGDPGRLHRARRVQVQAVGAD